MHELRWEILNKLDKPQDIIDVLLENRGVKGKKAKTDFLAPKHPEKFSVEELGINKKSLGKATGRIKKAIKDKEKIVIYGDYDADGVCATAILWEKLHSLGANATPFIPDRFEDGYGLNKKQISKLLLVEAGKTKNRGLIITVDNGIVAFEAISEANKLGIDVIITDHHEKKEKLPKAFAIVHTTKTSGSGVSWILSQELKKDGKGIELAAIGTIADQLPLVGFNRSVAKYGLEVLNKTSRLGLRKLYATAGLLEKTIGTYEINFAIAPRINASGRMGSAMDALRLLCTTNPSRAEKLATDLNNLNIERQKKVDEALALAEGSLINQTSSLIFLSHEDYHEGIIGLVASRITEKYYRPTIVLSKGEKVAKASARSIRGFSIIQAVRAAEEFILEGGGHEMAAGFSIEVANLKKFQNKIEAHSKEILTRELLERKINVDCELGFNQINRELYNSLTSFEPYGVGNPAPVFVSRDIKVVSSKKVGRDSKHQKLILEQKGKKINAIAFNWDNPIEENISLVYRLSLNEWNNKSELELMVRDIKNE